MKRSLGLVIGALLGFGLYINTVQAIREVPVDFNSPTVPAAQMPCSVQFRPQEIPDDGSWLQVCLLDPAAPDDSTVTEVNVKYRLDHLAPDQLEVRLSRADGAMSQPLWERGSLVDGSEFGKATGLEAFNGTAAQGGWYFWVRDVVPGQSGWLREVSISVLYAPVGPLPRQVSGAPGRPTSLRIPPEVVKITAPGVDEKKTEGKVQSLTLEPDGWAIIMFEHFERVFPPSTGWTLFDANPNDGREYLWDDDDYRHQSNGSWAGWPANGGADGLDPAVSPYPPNAQSWMIYGPFDLSNATGATAAEVTFWLWRQIEITYDYLYFGASSDGRNFSGRWWDGTADWESVRFYLDNYLGAPNVWIGWYFKSDGSVEYEGPWIDNIVVRRYVPGQVTAQGVLEYADRNGALARGRFTKVHLYDQDPGGTDDLLATTTTDANGFFQFPARTNWDTDGMETSPYDRRLDLYAVFEADYNDSATARRRVTNFDDQTYKWNRDPITDALDGTADLSYSIPVEANREAMWFFQDLRRAWEYVHTNSGIDPGSVTARWEVGQNSLLPCLGSCFYALGPYIFIAHDNRLSADTVVHEAGHHYLWNATGWWLWWDIGCYDHLLFSQEDVRCAWSEGWADFLPLAVNGDACYDFDKGPCTGLPDVGHFNLEAHGLGDQFPQGDTVEGRVAGALYDLFDDANDGFDSAAFGFAPITEIAFQGGSEDRFSAFWDGWEASGQNKHHAVRAIYQNTIDYDTSPRFDPPLSDVTVLQGFSYVHVIDLWDYSDDDESPDAELSYQLTNVTNWRCGASLDGRWVNLTPQPGWLGWCDVTLRVSDSLKTADDAFRVTIAPVQSWVHLPLIFR